MADYFARNSASFGVVGELFVEMATVHGADKLQKRIDRGLDVNTTDCRGRTLLMHAVYLAATCNPGTLRRRMLAAICCLLCNFANVNITDERGDTALGLALKFRQGDLALLLLDYGATGLNPWSETQS